MSSRRWSRPSSLRLRLTVWYVAAMVVVLAVYAAGVFTFVSHAAFKTMDKRLRDDFRWAAEMAEQRPDGTLSWFEGTSGEDDEDSPWLQVWSPSGELLFRPAERAAAVGQPDRRARSPRIRFQRYTRATRIIVRADAAVHRGCVARIADAAHGHQERRRSGAA